VLPSRIPILAWYRRLIAQNFDGSKHCRYPGRPRIEPKMEAWIVQMAKENSGWGYERIVGALANLGNEVSDEIVGNAEAPRHCSGAKTEPNHDVEGIYPIAYGRVGRA
jgi:hypothetical protein